MSENERVLIVALKREANRGVCTLKIEESRYRMIRREKFREIVFYGKILNLRNIWVWKS